jgi:hypothetical protein
MINTLRLIVNNTQRKIVKIFTRNAYTRSELFCRILHPFGCGLHAVRRLEGYANQGGLEFPFWAASSSSEMPPCTRQAGRVARRAS